MVFPENESSDEILILFLHAQCTLRSLIRNVLKRTSEVKSMIMCALHIQKQKTEKYRSDRVQ